MDEIFEELLQTIRAQQQLISSIAVKVNKMDKPGGGGTSFFSLGVSTPYQTNSTARSLVDVGTPTMPSVPVPTPDIAEEIIEE